MNNISQSLDQRLMAACLRLARRHTGLTRSNPSVGTLIVQPAADDNGNPLILGHGITAIGGRPHAEPLALEAAGGKAKGATAYVTLEPCAHHGVTPPCAEALISAGVSRVVTAWVDPDNRVDGKGHQMLRSAGIEVEMGICANQAACDLAGYLARKTKNRPHVLLKLAISSDGMLGLANQGQVAITGEISRAQTHMMRAMSDAILVGSGTLEADNPQLSCRLSGLQHRSPQIFVLNSNGNIACDAKVFENPGVQVVAGNSIADENRHEIEQTGAGIFAAEIFDGRIALPELLEDMGGRGVSTLMVEGGAKVAASFLAADLVDEIALFVGPDGIGNGGIASPLTLDTIPDSFEPMDQYQFGGDRFYSYLRR